MLWDKRKKKKPHTIFAFLYPGVQFIGYLPVVPLQHLCVHKVDLKFHPAEGTSEVKFHLEWKYINKKNRMSLTTGQTLMLSKNGQHRPCEFS